MLRNLAALLGFVALALVGCGGSGERAIRIGVLADCTGFLGPFNELELASAELPLLERGARLTGSTPHEGVSHATVAGKRVDIVTGCAESTTYEVLIAEARRLVEQEHVDVLIGPPLDSDGLVLREIARRSPNVTFLLTLSRAQETTLRHPATNVFRFQPDGAQQTAGLGSYAYHQLGWRSAAVVGDDFATSWARAAGFIAEFCALGGQIATRIFPPAGAPAASLIENVPPAVDGVALVPSNAFIDWSGFVRTYAQRRPNVARHLVLGPEMLILPDNRARLARLIKGGIAAGSERYDATNLTWLRFRREFGRHFPRLLPARSVPAEYPLALAYRNASEAIVEALGRVDGDLSGNQRRFRRALGRLTLETPTGVIRLDANRQAVAPAYLTQVSLDAKKKPTLRTLRVIPGVEQTFNGYFGRSKPPPSTKAPTCRQAKPPPWARNPG
jgi:branched-chain amino acid transport system substrate-binding protein